MQLIDKASLDSVIQIHGIVSHRPEKQRKTDIKTGSIEILVDELQILGSQINSRISNRDYDKADEEIRMKFRYLDLRNELLQKRLKFRAELIRRMRYFMDTNHFIEIETPTLVRPTPGVRIFIC